MTVQNRSAASLTFGMVPDADDTLSRAAFAELCEELSSASSSTGRGAAIAAHFSRSPADLAAELGADRVQLGWVSPTLLVTASGLQSAVPLSSSMRQGVTEFHGAVFVRQDSPIKNLLDLRGTHAAWVAPTSSSGYLFPRLVLASHGIDPTTFFASESFHHSHGNVARAVLSGNADVGGAYAMFEAGDSTRRLLRAPFLVGGPDGVPGRIVFTTSPIPSDLIVASPSVSPELRASLSSALLTLHQNARAAPAMQHLFGAESFVRFDPKSLEPLREQVSYGRELGLL